MMWRGLVMGGVLLVATAAWGARVSCNVSGAQGGTLEQAQDADGASANYFQDATKVGVGFQAHITAGSATVSVQACCRDALGSTGCDTDAEWGTLIGCSSAISSSGTANLLCPIDNTVGCRYRGFISTGTCLSSCSVDWTYSCSTH